MDEHTPQPICEIDLGQIKLSQVNGQIVAKHAKLIEPVEIDAAQLQRWVMKQIREVVA